MPPAVFVANAVMSVVALACCGWHARGDTERVAMLATGVVYGVLLEQLVILRFDAYRYNLADAVLVVGDVPLVIGFGWAAIVYSGYHVARRFDVAAHARPLFVALFALHIDLAIDAVAIRVPFWTWTPPGVWLGVPLGNFVGWFLVAALYTAAWDGLRSRGPLALRAPGSAVLAVVSLVVVLQGWETVATTLTRKVAILGPALLVSAAVVARDGVDLAPVDPLVVAVPALYHGFYLVVALALGMYEQQPLVVGVSLAMIAVSALLHRQGFARSGTGST
jgi:uncharacterized membrane protein